MLTKLIHHIYFKKSYFYLVIAVDFVFILLFAFVYSHVLPWLDKPALKFNIIQDGQVFGGPITDFVNCLYFSVTTQMTIGFGDIIPATELAKLFVSLQAAFGYFYLAFLVSILVGRVFSSKKIQSVLDFPHHN